MKLYDAIKEFLDWSRHQHRAAATCIQNESNLRQFVIFTGNAELEEVEEKDVLRYLALMENDLEIHGNSLIPKINALRQFFKYWNLRNFKTMSYELVPLRAKEFTFPSLCTHDDLEKFLAYAYRPSDDSRKIRNAALITMIANTGIRNGEAASMLSEKINVDVPAVREEGITMYGGVIKTEKSRGMKPFREIFWNEEANTIIRRWTVRRAELHAKHTFADPEILFVGLNSRHGADGWGRRLTPNAIDEIFRSYSRESGAKIRPHMLRHLLGRDMAEQDASDHVISDVLGHSRLDSSRTYTRLFGKAVAKQFHRFRGKQ